jgi:putative flippase GtrA
MGMITTIKQAFRYSVVGLSNTLLTLLIIWIMMKVFRCSDVLSNVIGYVMGVVNSFVWNKQWTFKSSDKWLDSAIRFGIVFGVCYLLQLFLLIFLKRHLKIDSYYIQIIAMAFYTVVNFAMNKYFTFRDRKE